MEELIFKYFRDITDHQKAQIKELYPLYKEWNSKINVISRKDIDNIYLHHILHSLAIAKFIDFPQGSTVIDVGTGGGFPGIPLAIMFPQTHFTLCDSIQKKITVVSEISSSLGLQNVTPLRGRAEESGAKFDFVVSRAVTELKNFLPWIWSSLSSGKIGDIDKGVIYLKGGDLENEINEACIKCKIPRKNVTEHNVSEWFSEEFFIEKKIIAIKR